MAYDNIVLGKDCVFTTNTRETGLNNNVVVVASSGCGKSHSVVEPTLMETNNSSLFVSAPRGYLKKLYEHYFMKKGYQVISMDFIHFTGDYGFDPMSFICAETDYSKIAHQLLYADPRHLITNDAYWLEAAETLLSALIAVVYMTSKIGEESFAEVLRLFSQLERWENGKTSLDSIFNMIEREKGNCFAVKQFRKIRQLPEKTFSCVLSTLGAFVCRFESQEISEFFERKKQIDFQKVAQQKTVVFVEMSDTDSTMYPLVNLFYSQAFDQLCAFADAQPNGQCLIPIRFILDDFASNTVINEMPRLISTIRAREISVMLILQSHAQLEQLYERDARTILQNCDSYVYMGGNDLDTARELGIRLDVPTSDLLYMDIGKEYVCRRGQRPMETERYDIRLHKEYRLVYSPEKEKIFGR